MFPALHRDVQLHPSLLGKTHDERNTHDRSHSSPYSAALRPRAAAATVERAHSPFGGATSSNPGTALVVRLRRWEAAAPASTVCDVERNAVMPSWDTIRRFRDIGVSEHEGIRHGSISTGRECPETTPITLWRSLPRRQILEVGSKDPDDHCRSTITIGRLSSGSRRVPSAAWKS